MTFSEQFAKYIVNVRYEDIPIDVIHFTKLCIVDYYASLLRGIEETPAHIMNDLAVILGGLPQATAVSGLKSSVTNVAFINGGASHVIELDDIHKASIVHAATAIMPAAIAVAEWKNVSGKKLIEGIIAGYEVAFRVGETVTPSHYYYFHNTATCGTFGATAAVAKILDLSEEQIVEAFGSAGTQAAGLWEFIEDGAMSKQLHPGKAGMNGIISCLLAERGFTGAKEIFEGRRGFFNAMSEQYDVTKMTQGIGDGYKILENSFKIHASCRHTHAAMDLAVLLHKTGVEKGFDQIDSIKVGVYKVALDITNDANPQTIYAAKFSMQFCVALVLIKGKGGLNEFNKDTLQDPAIRDVMKKIEVNIDEEINSKYPNEWGAQVEVAWKDGTTSKLASAYPKGDPENALTEADFVRKFQDLVPLKQQQKDAILEQLLSLERISVRDLIAAIHPKIQRV
jgi:2-methylcitrate dehydratase PrpD